MINTTRNEGSAVPIGSSPMFRINCKRVRRGMDTDTSHPASQLRTTRNNESTLDLDAVSCYPNTTRDELVETQTSIVTYYANSHTDGGQDVISERVHNEAPVALSPAQKTYISWQLLSALDDSVTSASDPAPSS